MRRYGTDRPDLRFGLPIVDIGDLMKAVEFKVFAAPANDPNARVAARRTAFSRSSAERRGGRVFGVARVMVSRY